MDLDGDGRLDILSGSYPGEIYLFKGQEDGGFAESTQLVDAEGDVVKVGSAAAVFAADWDRDGDLDLVIGDIRGQVWLLPGQSGGTTLSLGAAKKLGVGAEDIRVPHGDAGPSLADWDGDGTLDLILGCGDGSVRFYANASASGEPELLEPEILLASQGGMNVKMGEPVRCGARVKPCVVDFNGDGRLDLLLGDVLIETTPPPEMSAGQEAEKARAAQKLAWVQKRYTPALARVRKAVCDELGVEEDAFTEGWGKRSKEEQQRYRDVHAKLTKQDVEATALMKMMQAAWEVQRAYQGEHIVSGHVWVMMRGGASSLPGDGGE